MPAGFHVAGASFLHRLHPSVKIIVLALAFLATLVIDHPLHLAGLFLLYAALCARSGVFQSLKRVWWLMLVIALMSFVIWALTQGGGEVVFSAGPLKFTEKGLLRGAGMGVRLDLMLFLGLVFLSSTSVEDVNFGLSRMGVPFAVGFALSLSIRLVPLMIETVKTIIDAQRARGLDPGSGGPLTRAKNFVPLLVPVLVSAMRRTDQLATALEAKGFGRSQKRGSYREHKFGAPEIFALFLSGAVLVFLVMGRTSGIGGI